MNLSNKRILISPLNWGLGHATRCIPIIRLLIKKNASLLIAADGRALELLKKEFPDLEFISFKGIHITYPAKGAMMPKIFFSIPKIIFGIYLEHQTLKKIIAEKKIDIVISDNRFGLWNKGVKSIFITHQLMIKAPFAERLLHTMNLYFIKKYSECWIPDVEDAINLSGDLAHKYVLPRHSFFVGALSRFQEIKSLPPPIFKYTVMAIVSGPEPQRSIFEKLIVEQIKRNKLKALVVCGKTETEQKREHIGDLEIVSHLKADEMQEAILQSKIIIARSGYSTVMDLAVLGKKAVFVPTPGQTEQEYLAERFMQKGIAYYQKQSEFDLERALKECEKYRGFEMIINSDFLEKRIDNLINIL